jgi:ABC-2 type transport system permease protein
VNPYPASDAPVEAHETQPHAMQPQAMQATRPFYWSLRRELWESRSIYIAPLATVALVLVGFLVTPTHPAGHTHDVASLSPANRSIMLAMPYSHAAFLMILISVLVGLFYCLDALHGERRDRSILFWKSLPVSDLVTVLAKASIPLVVLPLLTFVLTVAVQWIMLLLSSLELLLGGVSVPAMWAELPIVQLQLMLLYSVVVITLWYAPVYAWLLLVAGWARRGPFLWIVLPPVALASFERITFGTSYIFSLLKDCFVGFAAEAFNFKMPDGSTLDPHLIPLSQLTPARFLGDPALWIGLVLAALFLAAAVRLRHSREPV